MQNLWLLKMNEPVNVMVNANTNTEAVEMKPTHFSMPTSHSPTSARVRVLRFSRSPWQLLVETFAALTVQPFCVVLAQTASVDLINQKQPNTLA